MNSSHTWERLSLAVDYLATSASSLRERALAAYDQFLRDLHAAEFAKTTRKDFENLRQMVEPILERALLDIDRLQHHDLWEVAKNKIRDSTGRKIAELILKIHRQVEFDQIKEACTLERRRFERKKARLRE